MDTEINGVFISGEAVDAVERITAEINKMWQAHWDSSTKGRTTYSYLPDIEERLQKEWLRPDFVSSQVLTGHGDFRDKLASLGLAESGACSSCGVRDTPEHLLLECPISSEARDLIKKEISGKGWPEVARVFVSNEEAFRNFRAFCGLALKSKAALITPTASTTTTANNA